MPERLRKVLHSAGPPALTLVALVALLEGAVALGLTPITIPAPSAVFAAFGQRGGRPFVSHRPFGSGHRAWVDDLDPFGGALGGDRRVVAAGKRHCDDLWRSD